MASVTVTGPVPPALPPPPGDGYFDETQWAVLMAVLDTVIPSIKPASAVTDDRTQHAVDDGRFDEITAKVQTDMAEPPPVDILNAYLEDRPSANPAFMDALRRMLTALPDSGRRQLGAMLSALA